MNLRITGKLSLFLMLITLQVIVFNKINLFGYATPFLYFLPLLVMNTSTTKNKLMFWGFSVGLIIDMFSNTPGVNAAATVFLAYFRTPILHLYTPRDAWDNINPMPSSVGAIAFLKYMLTCVLIHHSLLLMLETFTFIYWNHLIVSILASVMLSSLCIWIILSFVRK
jgi:rod shape-determining protein MreD